MPSLIDENTQFTDTDGLPIVSGTIYIGTQNTDPVANPITIYSDRDLTTPISNPQSLNGYGRSSNKIWIPGKYSVQVNNSASVQKFQDLDAGDVTQTGISVLSNVQGTNTITAEGSPAIATLTDQQQYNFTTAGANTGAVTLQIDLTAAKSIKKQHDVDLTSGDFEVGQIVAVVYNATDDVYELASNVNTTLGVIAETADHTATPVAGFGEYWVKDSTPNEATFTDDAGADHNLLRGVVQVVNVMDGAVSSGTGLIPTDDTIPQNTEGDEYMTLAITPTNTANALRIEVVVNASNSVVSNTITVALFQDSTADAIAACITNIPAAANQRVCIPLTHYMTAGTASATTFKIRAGASGASTTTFNGASATRELGGIMASSITITEITV